MLHATGTPVAEVASFTPVVTWLANAAPDDAKAASAGSRPPVSAVIGGASWYPTSEVQQNRIELSAVEGQLHLHPIGGQVSGALEAQRRSALGGD
jgi:hypothetical protein